MTADHDLSPLRKIAWSIVRPLIWSVARPLWRLRVEYRSLFPEPPFVIAANHHSFLDPAMVGVSYGKRQRFIALVDLFGNYRWLDWTLRTFEVITIRRQTVPLAAVREALGHLAAGGVVSVFPEGTRAATFGDIPPRPGAAWLAVRAKVPVVAVAVIGSDQVLGIDNRLRRGRIRVVVGPSFYPEGTGRQAVNDLTRRWSEWMSATLEESG